jgi:hypothetical protein
LGHEKAMLSTALFRNGKDKTNFLSAATKTRTPKHLFIGVFTVTLFHGARLCSRRKTQNPATFFYFLKQF